jgi:maltose/maltodextrin transport system substrate-binding protein
MWEYKSPYFSFPFLASAGAYSFKRTGSGYDLKDIGVDNAGAVKGLKAIIDLIKEDVLPKGSTQSVMDQKMSSGELATMVNGPWVWSDLRKSGIDFELAPVPGVGGNPGKPFVGIFTRSSTVRARAQTLQYSFSKNTSALQTALGPSMPTRRSAFPR